MKQKTRSFKSQRRVGGQSGVKLLIIETNWRAVEKYLFLAKIDQESDNSGFFLLTDSRETRVHTWKSL